MICCLYAISFFSFLLISQSLPVYDNSYDSYDYEENNSRSFDDLNNNNTLIDKYQVEDKNGTVRDLYLIRTIIYEVGILTNVAESEETKNVTAEKQEQIDVTIFKPTKDELIDLTKIPKEIKSKVEELTDAAFDALKVIPAVNISPENNTNTQIEQLALFPDSFARITTNISTINAGKDGKRDREDGNEGIVE